MAGGGGRLQGMGGSNLPGSSGYSGPFGQAPQIMGQTGSPGMTQTPQAPGMATAQGAAPVASHSIMGAPPSFMFGGQGQAPSAPPIQNPPTGGVVGQPGYSQGTPPQLSGGYWNQIAQMLAGPQYQSKPPATSQSLAGSNPSGTLPAYSNFPAPGAAGPQPGVGAGMQPTSVPGWYQNYS